MRFVVVGGDAAGMSAASRAKRNDPDLDITVFEMTNDVSYSACGMPYNIADPDRAIDDLVVRQARVFREKQGIDLMTGHQVISIDPSSKRVAAKRADGRELDMTYDELLIATGASPRFPDLPGFDLPGVMTLKKLEDGRRIKQYVASHGVRQAVIIGMGYIALEMVEAFRARDIQVSMVKPRPVFLPWMNREMASVVEEEVKRHDVPMYMGQQIEAIERSDHGLKVHCADMSLVCQMVLVATGIRPNSELARDAGLELGPSDSIAVDRTMQTSDEHIYAAGDCADAFHVVTGQRTWVPLALRANRAGWAVADNITGKRVELEGIAGTAVFKVFDLQVARTGLSVQEAGKYGTVLSRWRS